MGFWGDGGLGLTLMAAGEWALALRCRLWVAFALRRPASGLTPGADCVPSSRPRGALQDALAATGVLRPR
jgi:hypothetical protein